MSLHIRDKLSDKFHVFAQLFPEFTSTDTVLDFGGNRGNLLYFSNGAIQPSHYTSVDVDTESLYVGKNEFPAAKWIHYNKFNWMYNHTGIPNPPFPDISTVDYIWAYSVFTHTDYNDLFRTIEWFYTLGFKKCAISVLDINNAEVIAYFRNKRIEDYGSCIDVEQCSNNNIVYLGNNDQLFFNDTVLPTLNLQHLATFYNLAWLETQLKQHFKHVRIEYLTTSFSPFIILN